MQNSKTMQISSVALTCGEHHFSPTFNPQSVAFDRMLRVHAGKAVVGVLCTYCYVHSAR